MKKVIILIALVSTLAFAEVWDIHLTTSLNVSNSQDIKLFSNSFGNNILVLSTSGTLTYCNMSTTGTVISTTIVESNGASLSCITGDNYNTYVVYVKNNVVKATYTTNGGTNWVTLYDLGVNPNSLDAAFTDRLHITYCYNNAIIYYQYYNNGWTNSFTVSGTETGTIPRIQPLFHSTIHKIYVVYQNGVNCRSRELNVPNNSWDILRFLYYSQTNNPVPMGFGVDDNYIYNYFKQSNYDQLYGWTTWTAGNTIRKSDYGLNSSMYYPNYFQYIKTTNTADNLVHTVFNRYHITGYSPQNGDVPDGLEHEVFNNGTENIYNIISPSGTRSHIYISSSYNDLYSIWIEGGSNYLSYAHYNTYPSAPQNLLLVNNGGHPRLTWPQNFDPDVNNYKVYRNYGVWTCLGTTSNLYYDDPNIVINTGQLAGTEVYYKITAVDLGGLESQSYSNIVSCNTPGGNPAKKGHKLTDVVTDYELLQNYPNPFNPSTNISYQLPKAGVVQLKIYDLLGKEVAVLVDEFKLEGKYFINFDAAELANGVYIYSLKVNDFVQNKKMTLLK
jgi:hypothetical protein